MTSPTRPVQVHLEAAGWTDIGLVRTVNQDSLLVDLDRRLFIVADGMGGHAGGEIASGLCVKSIAQFLSDHASAIAPADATPAGETLPKHPDHRLANVLAQAINHASTRIYERALEDPALRGMGTTATVLKIIDDHAYIAHVGDSRCYLMRCGFIYQVTNDHSLVSEQLRAGVITKEEAELHHLRNVITRSVGYQEEEDVDTTAFALEDGDSLLLCSDGLHGKVTDLELSLKTKSLGITAVAPLVALANERGGDDNITVIVVHISIPTR